MTLQLEFDFYNPVDLPKQNNLDLDGVNDCILNIIDEPCNKFGGSKKYHFHNGISYYRVSKKYILRIFNGLELVSFGFIDNKNKIGFLIFKYNKKMYRVNISDYNISYKKESIRDGTSEPFCINKIELSLLRIESIQLCNNLTNFQQVKNLSRSDLINTQLITTVVNFLKDFHSQI